MRRAAFADLPEALEWLADHWAEREIPLRLHEHSSEGYGPFFTPAFARHLDAKPDDKAPMTTTRTCAHVRLPKQGNPWDCPDCNGVGVYDQTSEAYRYPMWRAMTKLEGYDRAHRSRAISATEIILTLVINGYDSAGVASLGITQDAQMSAIRRLHDRYERAPLMVKWTHKSQSQQNAESVVAYT